MDGIMTVITLVALLISGQGEHAAPPGGGIPPGGDYFSWTAILGLGVGVVVASSGILIAWLNNGTRLMKRVDELTTQMFKLQDELLMTKKSEFDLKMDLGAAQRRIEMLEAGATCGHTSIPGVMILNFQGVITEYSPSLTVSLGWTSDEMRGQAIDKIIPDEKDTFANMTKPGAVIDPTREHNTYAIDKNGRRVAVMIKCRKWAGPEGLMTVTLVSRPSGTATAAGFPPGTPMRRASDV